MSTESKVIIGALVLLICGLGYSHFSLSKQLRHTQHMASTCHCGSGSVQVAGLSTVTQNQVSASASHTYFELLLEGLARRAGLPMDKAKAQFRKETAKRKLISWRWLPVWEKDDTAPPKAPATAAPAAKPPGVRSKPSKGDDLFDPEYKKSKDTGLYERR